MIGQAQSPEKLRVIVAGGGVAALETTLALADLAGDRVELTVIAPNSEFVYRPMTVREPFAYAAANRYPLALILGGTGATLFSDELAWVDPAKQTIHTKADRPIEYDALMLALGANVIPRYRHALTIDDQQLEGTLHGLIQDIEGGYIQSLAFVSPGRMAWPMPMYELALMTAGRAYEMDVELSISLVTPEDSPLAIFGAAASNAVGELLQRAKIRVFNSAYAEIPTRGQVVINPGDHRLQVDRVIALPELYGPSLRGVPLGEHGFIRVNPYGQVADVGPIYAAGDATEFAIKHGGIASQQADTAAQSIAALAGAPLTPEPFHPVIHGMLLTDGKPLYLTAQITGGHGFSSEITDTPTWSPASKIAAKYLAPCLEEYDNKAASAKAASAR
ncbi:MAG: FAD-dependent oxidoreductase [Solirubrobacteraceae bacterium]|jgi:sulfide:quinone oxidoreductase